MAARYAARLGAADKFHRTVSEAMMRMLVECGAADRSQDWNAFIQRSAPVLADARAHLARHYSAALLASEAARRTLVQPDLLPLPC